MGYGGSNPSSDTHGLAAQNLLVRICPCNSVVRVSGRQPESRGFESHQRRMKRKNLSKKVTRFIGTPLSIWLHTGVFVIFGFLALMGYDINTLMLILTTIVSLEAIYLSLLIQLTVNRHEDHLEEMAEDIEDIQEDME